MSTKRKSSSTPQQATPTPSSWATPASFRNYWITGGGFAATEAAHYYDLVELIQNVRSFTATGTRYGELNAAAWIGDLLSTNSALKIVVDNQANFLAIPPLIHSTNARPDVCVQLRDNALPLLCVEVHSGKSYQNSVAKTVGVLLDQLRVLRNLDPSIKKVTGFTLPKIGTPTALTKITVAWHNFSFSIDITVAKTPDIARLEVQRWEADNPNLLPKIQAVTRFPTRMNLLPLSDDDLKEMRGTRQIPSQSSIVVYRAEEKVYLKYNPTLHRRFRYKSGVVVQAQAVETFGHAEFSVYPAQKQITFQEARDIKHQFVKAVSEALTTLHEVDGIAHLDVRFENICYEEGSVRFIDLDRAESADWPAVNAASLYTSEMYKVPPGEEWTVAQLDWKQLGMLIQQLENSSMLDYDLNQLSVPLSSALEKSLILKGIWDERAYLDWART